MIKVDKLSLTLGKFSLKDVSFQIDTGRYGVLMGRTGCGKTSILEAVCGLNKISSGKIELMGHDVTHLKAAYRGVGYVPQDLALFSNMSVLDHLEFALNLRKVPVRKCIERSDELAELLGISHLLNRRVQKLSGGEKQRVALGRALSAKPQVLCLDEPLSALDEDTNLEICSLLRQIQKETGVTVLHITHSFSEAERLADDIFRLENGIITKER